MGERKWTEGRGLLQSGKGASRIVTTTSLGVVSVAASYSAQEVKE